MKTKRIALVGYGRVGRALLDMLADVDPSGKLYAFSGIATESLGVIELGGMPAGPAAAKMSTARRDGRPVKGSVYDEGIASWLKQRDYDVLVEVTSSNYFDAEPALTYLLAALEGGRDAVTANKAPVAMFYDRLQSAAAKSGSRLRFESTVMDGTPIFSTFRKAMPDVEVKKVRGILNSTCNIVLDALYAGKDLKESITRAKRLGTAEDDPDKDLSGFDAAAKIVILSNTLTDTRIQMSDVRLERLDEKSFAKARGRLSKSDPSIIRQVSTADFERNIFRVTLEAVKPEDILFSCRGASSIVNFSLDLFGSLTISETNPTLKDTAFGIYSDLMDLCSPVRS